MKVITAPEKYIRQDGDVFCFLAGGITNCWEWQNAVINQLATLDDQALNIDFSHLIIFNPRRENFPIHDPNASEEQIKWEFNAIEQCDIFSMYFCADNSDQPICMYELGRNLVRMNEKFPGKFRTIISVEKGYKRAADVKIQTELTGVHHTLLTFEPKSSRIVYLHAAEIVEAYNSILLNWQ